MYNGTNDPKSDYSLVLVSNRDEYYDRHTQNMAPWNEDPNVLGGVTPLIKSVITISN